MAIGPILKEAREARGLTLSQVAEKTNMLTRVIEGLEHDDFKTIHAPIYGRGFITLYANLLGLNPEPLIEDYFAQIANGVPSGPSDLDQPKTPAPACRKPRVSPFKSKQMSLIDTADPNQVRSDSTYMDGEMVTPSEDDIPGFASSAERASLEVNKRPRVSPFQAATPSLIDTADPNQMRDDSFSAEPLVRPMAPAPTPAVDPFASPTPTPLFNENDDGSTETPHIFRAHQPIPEPPSVLKHDLASVVFGVKALFGRGSNDRVRTGGARRTSFSPMRLLTITRGKLITFAILLVIVLLALAIRFVFQATSDGVPAEPLLPSQTLIVPPVALPPPATF